MAEERQPEGIGFMAAEIEQILLKGPWSEGLLPRASYPCTNEFCAIVGTHPPGDLIWWNGKSLLQEGRDRRPGWYCRDCIMWLSGCENWADIRDQTGPALDQEIGRRLKAQKMNSCGIEHMGIFHRMVKALDAAIRGV